jgi:circadian clock protein KaiB
MTDDNQEEKIGSDKGDFPSQGDHQGEFYDLKLYITGLTPRSLESIQNIKSICEEELKGRYHLDIIDITKDPEAARKADIVAVPTLIKNKPLPMRRLIGELSNKNFVLKGMDIQKRRS